MAVDRGGGREIRVPERLRCRAEVGHAPQIGRERVPCAVHVESARHVLTDEPGSSCLAIPPSVHRGSAHALLRVRREQATASRSLLGVEEVVASSAPRLQASTPLAEQSWRFLTVGPRTDVTQRRSAVGFPSRTAYGMCSRRQPRWGRLCLDAGPRLPSARPMKPPAEPTSVTLMSPLSLHLRDLLRQAIDQYVRARTTPPATRCCGECGADYSDLPGPVLGCSTCANRFWRRRQRAASVT